MQLLLSTVCLALTSAVIGNAYYQKNQFYPAVVYITKSNASMAVIYIQFFVIVFMFGKLLRKIFLGTLRAAEFEHLLERFWYALTETFLAFTVFRDDFNPRFVALFTVLLFLKSFHWLAEERVDFMERSPVLGVLFHIRVTSLLSVLGILDYMLLMHAYSSTLVRGPTVQLVFGFEYAILFTVVASTAVKYVLHAWEMRTDTPWENKAVFLLYTELVIGLIKVVLYILFVVIMAKIYALPMFVFRPMFFTIRNFKKALSDVIMSRRAIRNMNTLYPDATPEELRLSDNICIICREDMVSHSKKLPCGHIFHTTCLRSWFQRQQTCPTCRLNILRTRQEAPTAAPAAGAAAAPAAAGLATPGVDGVATANVAAGGGVTAGNDAASNSSGGGGGASSTNVNATQSDRPNVTNIDPVMLSNLLGGSTSTATRAAASNSFPLPAGLAMPSPFMMPSPFGFMPPPFAMPPPPEIPTGLVNFTDDELRAMEGNERRNIEERMKLLRNIQTMLDAAGVLMTNYQLVVTRMQTHEPSSTTTQPSTSGTVGVVNTVSDDLPSTSATKTPNNTIDAQAAKLSLSTATTIKPTIDPIASSITEQAKHNEVTIEDIGGEEHEYDLATPNATSSLSANASPVLLGGNDEAEGELDNLRRRRLKFLEERNKPPSSN